MSHGCIAGTRKRRCVYCHNLCTHVHIYVILMSQYPDMLLILYTYVILCVHMYVILMSQYSYMFFISYTYVTLYTYVT